MCEENKPIRGDLSLLAATKNKELTMTNEDLLQIEANLQTVLGQRSALRRTLGHSIARARTAKGLSRGQLGRVLGVQSQKGLGKLGQQLASVERGNRLISAREVENWSPVLGLQAKPLLDSVEQASELKRRAETLQFQQKHFWVKKMVWDIKHDVQQSEQWLEQEVPATGFFLYAAFLRCGQGSLTRRDLLELWRQPIGRIPCSRCAAGQVGFFFGARSLARFLTLWGICDQPGCGLHQRPILPNAENSKDRLDKILKFTSA
jgi:transcriptional regulator with XRE-family HTH domain